MWLAPVRSPSAEKGGECNLQSASRGFECLHGARRSRGACISANFGAQPFRFALDDMLAEERAQQEAAVQQCAFPGIPVLHKTHIVGCLGGPVPLSTSSTQQELPLLPRRPAIQQESYFNAYSYAMIWGGTLLWL